MSYTEDATHTILKYNLSRLTPLRIVLLKEKDEYLGLVENSFSMDYIKNKVRIWWSGKAYSFLGEHNINGIDDAKHNAGPGDLVFDPFDELCPIEIDWEKWINATSKFDKRNASFKVK